MGDELKGKPAADHWRAGVIACSLVSVAICSYLTYVHLRGIAPVCVDGGCAVVQASKYAKVGEIPVSALGLGFGLSVLLAAVLRPPGWNDLAAGLCVAGVLFSAYLTYLELAVIKAICWWCVSHAIVVVILSVCVWGRWLAGYRTGSHPPDPEADAG